MLAARAVMSAAHKRHRLTPAPRPRAPLGMPLLGSEPELAMPALTMLPSHDRHEHQPYVRTGYDLSRDNHQGQGPAEPGSLPEPEPESVPECYEGPMLSLVHSSLVYSANHDVIEAAYDAAYGAGVSRAERFESLAALNALGRTDALEALASRMTNGMSLDALQRALGTTLESAGPEPEPNHPELEFEREAGAELDHGVLYEPSDRRAGLCHAAAAAMPPGRCMRAALGAQTPSPPWGISLPPLPSPPSPKPAPTPLELAAARQRQHDRERRDPRARFHLSSPGVPEPSSAELRAMAAVPMIPWMTNAQPFQLMALPPRQSPRSTAARAIKPKAAPSHFSPYRAPGVLR